MEPVSYTHLAVYKRQYYYWYYRTYKGVPLWDLLLRAGLDKESIDESLPVNFEAADYYNFPPLTVGEIRNDELYGYYEKDWLDKGDGTFDGRRVEPLKTGYPVLIACLLYTSRCV